MKHSQNHSLLKFSRHLFISAHSRQFSFLSLCLIAMVKHDLMIYIIKIKLIRLFIYFILVLYVDISLLIVFLLLKILVILRIYVIYSNHRSTWVNLYVLYKLIYCDNGIREKCSYMALDCLAAHQHGRMIIVEMVIGKHVWCSS